MGSLFSRRKKRGMNEYADLLTQLSNDIKDLKAAIENGKKRKDGRFLLVVMTGSAIGCAVTCYVRREDDLGDLIRWVLPFVVAFLACLVLEVLARRWYGMKVRRSEKKLEEKENEWKETVKEYRENADLKRVQEAINEHIAEQMPPRPPVAQQRQPQQQQQGGAVRIRDGFREPVCVKSAGQEPGKYVPRTTMQRCLDFVFGDSPKDNYSLVCGNCWRVNGFVPAKEYNTAKFRCRWCGAFNSKDGSAPEFLRDAPEEEAPKPEVEKEEPVPAEEPKTELRKRKRKTVKKE